MYRIWYQVLKDGEHVSSMVSTSEYRRKGYAEYIAKKNSVNHDSVEFRWIVSEENPWKEKKS